MRVKSARNDTELQDLMLKAATQNKPEIKKILPPRSPRESVTACKGDHSRLSEDMHDTLYKLKIKSGIRDSKNKHQISLSPSTLTIDLNHAKKLSVGKEQSDISFPSPILASRDLVNESKITENGHTESSSVLNDISSTDCSESRFNSSTLVESVVEAGDEYKDESNCSSSTLIPCLNPVLAILNTSEQVSTPKLPEH